MPDPGIFYHPDNNSLQASVKKRDVVLGEVLRNQQKLEKLQKLERTGQVLVVDYNVTILALNYYITLAMSNTGNNVM